MYNWHIELSWENKIGHDYSTIEGHHAWKLIKGLTQKRPR